MSTPEQIKSGLVAVHPRALEKMQREIAKLRKENEDLNFDLEAFKLLKEACRQIASVYNKNQNGLMGAAFWAHIKSLSTLIEGMG